MPVSETRIIDIAKAVARERDKDFSNPEIESKRLHDEVWIIEVRPGQAKDSSFLFNRNMQVRINANTGKVIRVYEYTKT